MQECDDEMRMEVEVVGGEIGRGWSGMKKLDGDGMGWDGWMKKQM